jgi:ATP-binding cassette, subfamily B, bacterial MsbA
VSVLVNAAAVKPAAISGWDQVARLFRHEKRLVLRFFATAIGRAVAATLVILLIQRFLSGAIGGGARSGMVGRLAAAIGPEATLIGLGAVLLLCQLSASLCNYGNIVAQLHIGKVVELGMLERLIRHLLALSVPFFDRQSHADVLLALREDVTHLRLTVRALANIILEASLFLCLVAGAISLDPWIALWSLLVIPTAAIPVFALAKRVLARSHEARQLSYALSDIILQILRGIRIIKAYRREEAHAEVSLAQGRLFFDAVIADNRMRSMASVVMESLAGMVTVSIIVIGGHRVLRGEISWPTLLSFVMAVRAMYGPINNLNTHYVELKAMSASVQRLAEILAARPEVEDRLGAAPFAGPPRAIAFERVGFSYGDGPVLEDVSFEVRAGETIGIVGPSGSGKSTLLNLLARFYDPGAGRVLLDGRDLRDLRVADVHAQMALVTQEPFLFSASVRDNIRVGRRDATHFEVEAAARSAFVHDDVESLPRRYDTPLGVGGRELSGGQRQRLTVARALLANAPLLLLDEATSSLDSVAEAEVQRAIDRLMSGRTSFVVAHRLSTLRHADRILVLDRGRVVGFAPHAELLRTCPTYRRLWDTQQIGLGARAAGPGAAA